MDERAQRFLEMHRPGRPLLLPNAWDRGSAVLLASLGFEALATTSSGHAATLGRLDGSVTRAEAIEHARDLAAATELPLSADLENGFAADPEGVAETVRLAAEAGLAGCSIEDAQGGRVHVLERAVEHVAAAAEAARGRLVLTARAENFLYGRRDLDDTIARLRAYEQAGADVLYAPGLTEIDDIRAVVAAVERPVNVLAVPGAPSVAELSEAGVARISVGGAFAFAALGALTEAARELREQGTYGFWSLAKAGNSAARAAFQPPSTPNS